MSADDQPNIIQENEYEYDVYDFSDDTPIDESNSYTTIENSISLFSGKFFHNQYFEIKPGWWNW